jgi:hypothetical protein
LGEPIVKLFETKRDVWAGQQTGYDFIDNIIEITIDQQ